MECGQGARMFCAQNHTRLINRFLVEDIDGIEECLVGEQTYPLVFLPCSSFACQGKGQIGSGQEAHTLI